MRSLPAFVSLIALLLALCAVVRLPAKENCWPVTMYLLIHAGATIGGWLLYERIGNTEAFTKAYVGLYSVMVAFAILVTMIAAGRASMWLVGIIGFGAAMTSLSEFADRTGNLAKDFVLFEAATLTFCGVCVLLTLAVPSSFGWDTCRKALAAFWLAQGLFHWFYAYGLHRDFQKWAVRSNWVPMAIAVLAFSWLAWQLSTHQWETARESFLQPPVSASVEHREPAYLSERR